MLILKSSNLKLFLLEDYHNWSLPTEFSWFSHDILISEFCTSPICQKKGKHCYLWNLSFSERYNPLKWQSSNVEICLCCVQERKNDFFRKCDWRAFTRHFVFNGPFTGRLIRNQYNLISYNLLFLGLATTINTWCFLRTSSEIPLIHSLPIILTSNI